MKHLLQFFICILLLGSSSQIFGQNNSLETETAFMNCIYNLSEDNGKEFKETLQKAVQILIDKNILKDDSGESYVVIYKNINSIVNQELGNIGMGKLFIAFQQNMDSEESRKCMKSVFTSPKFVDSKLYKFSQYTASIDENVSDFQTVAEELLTILDAKDFEHDYYKMATFLMIEAINTTDIVTEGATFPENEGENLTKQELEVALQITINAEGQLSVNGKKTAQNKLRKTVIKYMKEHKSKSVITLKINKDLSYKTYISIQNEIVLGIQSVRDELAKEKFNRSYEKLTETQKTEIKQTYPQKIKEMTDDK